MNTDWLEDFIALAETRKFTAAASLRECSQSTLSRRIQLLEEHLGSSLFDRRCTPLKLTVAGQALYPTSYELVRLSRECERSVTVQDPPLTFASLHTLACNFFPQWLGHFHDEQAPLYTRIDTGHKSTENYYMALLSGRCDFILFYRDTESQRYCDRQDFEVIQLGKDEILWVGIPAVAHAIADSQGPIPWLTYAPSAQLHALSRPQLSRHPTPQRLKRVFEATVSEALKPMVTMGYGIACMPFSMVAEAIERGDLVRLYPELPADHLEIILVRWLGGNRDRAETFWEKVKARHGRG
ncbi:LysR family transcriptional regulator [Halomonas elongata]|uniref:LysR family transcriptional regulator n=1 Tax=Halomonas elongata TaxID=2746 RepID=UPI0038D46086